MASSDSEFADLDDDLDDGAVFAAYKAQRLAEMQEPTEDAEQAPLRALSLTLDALRRAASRFTPHERETLTDYVNVGAEANHALRGGRPAPRNLGTRLSRALRPLGRLFPSSPGRPWDYVRVCRQTQAPWREDAAQGFLSAANRPVRQFGRYSSTILAPRDARAGVIDITAKLGGGPPTYELVFDKNTDLLELRTSSRSEEDMRTYVINTDYARTRIRAFAAAARPAN